jgi:hypothetical protein
MIECVGAGTAAREEWNPTASDGSDERCSFTFAALQERRYV